MAKMPDTNPYRRVQQPTSPPEPPIAPWQFRPAWIIVPLCMVGMFCLLMRVQPVISWDSVMEFLGVKNKERYTSLMLLCLTLTFIVAAVRILGRKDKE